MSNIQKNTKIKHDWSSIDLFYALKMAERGGVISRRVLESWRATADSVRGCYGLSNLDLNKVGFWQTSNADYDSRNYVCNLSGFGFGFEIEVETTGVGPSDVVKAVSRQFNKLCWCKRDGSLNCGTEVVTPVFSHDILNKNSLEMQAMTDLFDLLMEAKCTVPTSTGGHIHFSDPRLVGKTRDFCLFVEAVLQDCEPQAVKALFGRNINATSYAASISSELKNGNGTILGRLKKVRDTFGKAEALTDRYMFIHSVSDSAGHIEFRLPAGTLNVSKLAARVHFLNACVCEFIKVQNRDWLKLDGVFKRILKQIFKNVKGFKKFFAVRISELKGDEA